MRALGHGKAHEHVLLLPQELLKRGLTENVKQLPLGGTGHAH